MEINDEAKEIVQELGAAINSAVENSTEVAAAIERLREAGYEMELTLRLEIGLREHEDSGDDPEDEERNDYARHAQRGEVVVKLEAARHQLQHSPTVGGFRKGLLKRE